MKRYTSTKTLFAMPMTRGEYYYYRGWTLCSGENPDEAGYLVEYEDGGKANDSRHAGYISWSPADVFERSYHEEPKPSLQPKITGYRQLSDGEIALMNEAKALAEHCGEFIEKLSSPSLDRRWISIGATQLQQGFMALTRGIAQPTTF